MVDLTIVVFVGVGVWALIALLAIGLCRASARADAAAELIHQRLSIRSEPTSGPLPRVVSGF